METTVSEERVDALIVSVLPESEHPALLTSFGIDPFSRPHETRDGLNFWYAALSGRDIGAVSVAMTCMEAKGNVEARAGTERILRAMANDCTFLIGTAAGAKNKTGICDVVVGSEGIWYYERNFELSTYDQSRIDMAKPGRTFPKDIGNFYTTHASALGWSSSIGAVIQQMKQAGFEIELPTGPVRVHFRGIASGEKILDHEMLSRIAKHNDTIVAGEQEGWGFATACESLEQDWLVIRGISDFGNKAQRKRWAAAATVAACTYLRIYLENAFQWPRREQTLPRGSVFLREHIVPTMREYLVSRGLDMSPLRIPADLTINELSRLCETLFTERGPAEIRSELREARARAFESKYSDRKESDDERYVDVERWNQEFTSLLFELGISRLQQRRIVNVGIGNGNEGRGIYEHMQHLTGVDLSQKSLDRAKQLFPQMRCVVGDAEDLESVPNRAFELYVSLRTYQSRLFDIEAALLEAHRVLEPGGLAIISVPFRYALSLGYITGLQVQASEDVDMDLPYVLVERIRRGLNRIGFNNVGVRSGRVEIYVYGERGP